MAKGKVNIDLNVNSNGVNQAAEEIKRLEQEIKKLQTSQKRATTMSKKNGGWSEKAISEYNKRQIEIYKKEDEIRKRKEGSLLEQSGEEIKRKIAIQMKESEEWQKGMMEQISPDTSAKAKIKKVLNDMTGYNISIEKKEQQLADIKKRYTKDFLELFDKDILKDVKTDPVALRKKLEELLEFTKTGIFKTDKGENFLGARVFDKEGVEKIKEITSELQDEIRYLKDYNDVTDKIRLKYEDIALLNEKYKQEELRYNSIIENENNKKAKKEQQQIKEKFEIARRMKSEQEKAEKKSNNEKIKAEKEAAKIKKQQQDEELKNATFLAKQQEKEMRRKYANEVQFRKELKEQLKSYDDLSKKGTWETTKSSFAGGYTEFLRNVGEGKKLLDSAKIGMKEFAANMMSTSMRAQILTDCVNALIFAFKTYINFIKGSFRIAFRMIGNMFKSLGSYIKKATVNLIKFVTGTKKSKTALDKIAKALHSVWHVFRYMVMRMVFRAAIKNFTTLFNKLVEFSEDFNEKVSILYTSLIKLNAAIVVMVAPAIKAIAIPVQMLTSALVYLMDIMAQFNTVLFLNGTTYEKLNDFTLNYKDTLEKTGKAANKVLAPFDQINKLGSNKSGGSDLDNLDPNKIFAMGTVDENIYNYVQKIKNAFKNGDMTEIGEDLANSLSKQIDKGLAVMTSPGTDKKIETAVKSFYTLLNGFFKDPNKGESVFVRAGNLIGSTLQKGINAGNIFFGGKDSKNKNSGINTYNIGSAIMTMLNNSIASLNASDVGTLMGAIGNKIVQYMSGFVETWQPERWATFIVDVLKSAAETFSGSDLQQFFKNMFSSVANFMKTINEAWTDPKKNGVDAAQFVNGLLPSIKELSHQLVILLTKAISFMSEFVKYLDVQGIVNIITDAINTLSKNGSFSDLAQAIAKLLGAVFAVSNTIFWETLEAAITTPEIALVLGLAFSAMIAKGLAQVVITQLMFKGLANSMAAAITGTAGGTAAAGGAAAGGMAGYATLGVVGSALATAFASVIGLAIGAALGEVAKGKWEADFYDVDINTSWSDEATSNLNKAMQKHINDSVNKRQFIMDIPEHHLQIAFDPKDTSTLFVTKNGKPLGEVARDTFVDDLTKKFGNIPLLSKSEAVEVSMGVAKVLTNAMENGEFIEPAEITCDNFMEELKNELQDPSEGISNTINDSVGTEIDKLKKTLNENEVGKEIGESISENIGNSLESGIEGLKSGVKTAVDSLSSEVNTNLSTVSTNISNWVDGDFKNSLNAMINMFWTANNKMADVVDTLGQNIKSSFETLSSNLYEAVKAYNSVARELGEKTISYSRQRINWTNVTRPALPKLATGAVLPANKPFAAIVGDQKRGTNVEAPLDTIKQALMETMLEFNKGNNQPSTLIVPLEVGEREFGRAVIELGNKEARRIGTKFVTI